MKWLLQTAALVALILAEPARAATATPSGKEVAAAEVEEFKTVCRDISCHFYAPIQPSVRRLKCNVIASDRVSCRFLWRMTASQVHWLRYQEYARDGEGWHVHPRSQSLRDWPQPMILPPK